MSLQIIGFPWNWQQGLWGFFPWLLERVQIHAQLFLYLWSVVCFFSQNDKKTRVIRNPTVHDGIAGISSLVLEMYSDIKGLFIAGDSKVTTDDIKGFLQFWPNLGWEEIIIKEYLLKLHQRHIHHWSEVLLSLCHKFTLPTSGWALFHQRRVQQYQFYHLIYIFISRNITKVLPRAR